MADKSEAKAESPDVYTEKRTPPVRKIREPIAEVLPKRGLVYSEKSSLNIVFCKPKILPVKPSASWSLDRDDPANR
jgi:hypothetical protein